MHLTLTGQVRPDSLRVRYSSALNNTLIFVDYVFSPAAIHLILISLGKT